MLSKTKSTLSGKKKLAALAAAGVLLLSSAAAFATVERVPGPWELTAPSGIDFVCGGGHYLHTLNTVSQDSDGDFTGTGTYNPNTGYTWDADGNITGDDIAFSITYTGISAGSVYNLVGTIDADGSVTGTVDSNCQTFSMGPGTMVKFEGNHGQWVKMSGDKKGAAQSRVGMPVQSKGHTK